MGFGWKDMNTPTKGDVYKPVMKETGVCIICKEFSKGRADCPTCGRKLIWLGTKVSKVKKGSKTKWREFMKAYANQLYRRFKDDFGDTKELKEWAEDKVYSQYHGYLNLDKENREKHNDLLRDWAVEFDKWLDKNYRNKAE